MIHEQNSSLSKIDAPLANLLHAKERLPNSLIEVLVSETSIIKKQLTK